MATIIAIANVGMVWGCMERMPGVPPIFRTTDQQMPTGMPTWNTASPMSQRK